MPKAAISITTKVNTMEQDLVWMREAGYRRIS